MIPRTGYVSYFIHFDCNWNWTVQTIWPVVWVDEGADATEENLDLIKSMLVTHNMIHLT